MPSDKGTPLVPLVPLVPLMPLVRLAAKSSLLGNCTRPKPAISGSWKPFLQNTLLPPAAPGPSTTILHTQLTPSQRSLCLLRAFELTMHEPSGPISCKCSLDTTISMMGCVCIPFPVEDLSRHRGRLSLVSRCETSLRGSPSIFVWS
jgi:hypothetical protein